MRVTSRIPTDIFGRSCGIHSFCRRTENLGSRGVQVSRTASRLSPQPVGEGDLRAASRGSGKGRGSAERKGAHSRPVGWLSGFGEMITGALPATAPTIERATQLDSGGISDEN